LPADGTRLYIGIVCYDLESAVGADTFRLFSSSHFFLLHCGQTAGDRLHPAAVSILYISVTLVQVIGSR